MESLSILYISDLLLNYYVSKIKIYIIFRFLFEDRLMVILLFICYYLLV